MVRRPLGLAVGFSCVLVVETALHPMAGGSAQAIDGEPVSIHPGTCAVTIAEPVVELGDLLPPAREPADPGDVFLLDGPATTIGVLSEDTDADLDDLLAAPHAIVVHSTADYSRYLACGEISAAVDGEAEDIVVPLRQIDDSNVFGIAFLEPEDAVLGEERLVARVYLFSGLAVPTPTPATSSADEP